MSAVPVGCPNWTLCGSEPQTRLVLRPDYEQRSSSVCVPLCACAQKCGGGVAVRCSGAEADTRAAARGRIASARRRGATGTARWRPRPRVRSRTGSAWSRRPRAPVHGCHGPARRRRGLCGLSALETVFYGVYAAPSTRYCVPVPSGVLGFSPPQTIRLRPVHTKAGFSRPESGPRANPFQRFALES